MADPQSTRSGGEGSSGDGHKGTSLETLALNCQDSCLPLSAGRLDFTQGESGCNANLLFLPQKARQGPVATDYQPELLTAVKSGHLKERFCLFLFSPSACPSIQWFSNVFFFFLKNGIKSHSDILSGATVYIALKYFYFVIAGGGSILQAASRGWHLCTVKAALLEYSVDLQVLQVT